MILYNFYKSSLRKIVIFKVNIIKISAYIFIKIIEKLKNEVVII